MKILQNSRLIVTLPDSLKAEFRIGEYFHQLKKWDCTLVFLDYTLLHLLIESINSVNAAKTKEVIAKIVSRKDSVEASLKA